MIEKIIKKTGMSKKDLSLFLGTHITRIDQFLRGERKLTKQHMAALDVVWFLHKHDMLNLFISLKKEMTK